MTAPFRVAGHPPTGHRLLYPRKGDELPSGEYIEVISDPYRAVILLHDVQGLTNQEIAAMLGLSPAKVKIRLQ